MKPQPTQAHAHPHPPPHTPALQLHGPIRLLLGQLLLHMKTRGWRLCARYEPASRRGGKRVLVRIQMCVSEKSTALPVCANKEPALPVRGKCQCCSWGSNAHACTRVIRLQGHPNDLTSIGTSHREHMCRHM